MLRLALPPRGSIQPNNDVDPLKYYYAPVVGRVFRARIDLGLALLDDVAGPGARLGRVLEVGYGSGLLLPTLARGAERVDGIDLASEPAAVREAMARLGVHNLGDLAKGDIRRMPFSDASYDAVIAFSILEHLEAPLLAAALVEVARVLRPGGRFLVGCPAVHRAMNAAIAAIGFRGIEHHHVSSIHDVLAAVPAAGFSIEKRATMPRGVPLGLAPYNAVLLRKKAA